MAAFGLLKASQELAQFAVSLSEASAEPPAPRGMTYRLYRTMSLRVAYQLISRFKPHTIEDWGGEEGHMALFYARAALDKQARTADDANRV